MVFIIYATLKPRKRTPIPTPTYLFNPPYLTLCRRDGGGAKKFFYSKYFSYSNFFGPKIFLDPKFFWTQNFSGPKIFLNPKLFLDQNWLIHKTIFDQELLLKKNQMFLNPKICCGTEIKPNLGEPSKLKMSQIVEKVHNFLDPPPLGNLDYFEFGKKIDFRCSPPLDRNWEKFEM